MRTFEHATTHKSKGSGLKDRRFIAAFTAVLFWVCFWLFLIALRSVPISLPPQWRDFIFGCLGVVVALGLVKIFLGREKKTFADIGLVWTSGTIYRFVQGVVIGIVLVGLMLMLMIGLTSLEVERVVAPNYWNAIGYALLVLLVLAAMEEVIYRSYPLILLQRNFGLRAAIYTSSVAFAFYHGLDVMNLLGPGVWGLFFGLAAITSRGIALPLGFHFGLNWIQSFFGMKTQYASAIWMIVPGTEEGFISAEVLGIILQVVLLITGVLLIEKHIRKHGEATSN